MESRNDISGVVVTSEMAADDLDVVLRPFRMMPTPVDDPDDYVEFAVPYGNVQCPQMPRLLANYFHFPDEEWFNKVRREMNSRGATTGAKMKRVNRERRRAVYVLAQVLPADVCGVVWSFLKRHI